MRRKVVLTLAALLVLICGLILGVRAYLHSSRVVAQVTAQLEAIYGGPVSIQNVDIGPRHTTISGLKLFEPGDDPTKDAPWLDVATVSADVSLWRLIRGDVMPSRVRLHGVKALVRFDQQGALLTRVPTALTDATALDGRTLPDVTLEQGAVTIHKNGAGDLIVHEIQAQIKSAGGRAVLSGSGVNAEMGELDLDGSFESKSGMAAIRAKSKAAGHVGQATLNCIPFVPPAVWKEIQVPDAKANAELNARYDLHNRTLHYQVGVTTEKAKVLLPRIELAAHDVSGKLTIDDNLLQLRDAKALAYGGAIFTGGELDFRGSVTKLSIPRIAVEHLDVKSLSHAWGIPSFVRHALPNGKFFGTGSLEVTLGAAPKDDVRIHSQGQGEVRDPMGKRGPMQFDWNLAPHRSDVSSQPRFGTWSIGTLLTTLIAPEIAFVAEADQGKPKNTSEYLDLNFNLTNADLGELIENQGVKPPFPVQGKISVKVKASIPVGRLDDLKAYKAHGSATIKQFAAAGVKLDEVQADFSYADGSLQVKSFQGQPAADQAAVISGSGQIQVAPPGKMQADLTVARISLSKLAGLAPEKIRGDLSGKISLHGQFDKSKPGAGIEADGRIKGDGIAFHGINVEQFSASVTLKDGVFQFPDLQAAVEGIPIAAPGSLRLNEDGGFQANFKISEVSIAALQKLAAKQNITLPPASGNLHTDLLVRGKLSPLQIEASGNVEATAFEADALAAQELRFHWQIDQKKLAVSDVKVQLYDGIVSGNAEIPFDANSAGNVDLSVRNIDVNRLAKSLRAPFAIEGQVNGTLKGTLPAIDRIKDGNAKFVVDINAPRLRLQNIATEQVHGTVDYRQGAIDYKLVGKTLGGSFDLEGQVPGGAEPPKGKGGKAV